MPEGSEVDVEGMKQKARVHENGLLLFGNDGNGVSLLGFK